MSANQSHTSDNLPHTSNSIAIIGAGGIGREIRSLVEREYNFAGFYDDQPFSNNYLGSLDQISPSDNYEYLIAIGDPIIKQKIAQNLASSDLQFSNLVSKNTVIDTDCFSGHGIVVCDGVIATIDYQIGAHVLVNLNVTIGHDVNIGSFCSIMPGANISGNVKIGEATLIGSGATILQGITIGSSCRVGAGAVVTKNIVDNSIVVGIPAKPI